MTYSDCVATIAMIVAVIAVPATGYLSYYFAIKGEKRKEWNQASIPIREKLISHIDDMRRGQFSHPEVKRIDILKFSDIRGKLDNSDLMSAYDEYENSHQGEEVLIKTNKYTFIAGDLSKPISASEKLLTLITRK
ncbi:TPA: hypothetical protein RUZ49_005214 [Klebsiella pneumoniae]|uniref:hypothetical protein n=1 Tax=Klebsiella pneumoniae TaxID=573 RepID=UPI000B42143A|nr:hypothetical protein [Klebsiella pneumoniae]OVX10801.1 hypothetical protein BME40_23040 [Klebsiella pneumoniae]HDS4550182.1 hypothetical protein [Klebsiella pneumoniae subsp. pneumoniae]HDT4300495.1 hypothetical protein [Klebsiella pneumoniae subsp. pneumoniae]HDZ9352675.1 hypothetical protein [Klebsiella pneumoniae]